MCPLTGAFYWRRFAPPPNFRVKVSMKNDFYTYAYLREDGTPYYIGKGCGRRCRVKHGRTIHPPTNLSRILVLKEGITEEEAIKHEIYMIAVLGRKDKNTGILRNMTDGGDGVSGLIQTEEVKEKIKKSKTGVNLSKKHKDSIKKSIRNSEAYRIARTQPVLGTGPDGEVFYFSTIKEASETTGIKNISRCCRGLTKKAGGWCWTYFR